MHHQPAQWQLTVPSAPHEKPHFSIRRERRRSIALGLPAQLKQDTKRVTFDPPLRARLVTPDGSWSAACEVMTLWETGARLRVQPPPPVQFILLFAWSPTVVSRLCKRVRWRGEDLWVDYVRQRPSYSMEYDR